jgi:glycosyltransferase involved in cell wall biosynthesis
MPRATQDFDFRSDLPVQLSLKEIAVAAEKDGATPAAVAQIVCDQKLMGNIASPGELLQIADELMGWQMPAAAYELFHRIVALDLENVEALFGLARSCRSMGEIPEAIAHCEDVIASHRDADQLLSVGADTIPTLMQWVCEDTVLQFANAQWDALKMYGELRSVQEPALLKQAAKALVPAVIGSAMFSHAARSRIFAIMMTMGFSRGSSRDWRNYLFEALVVPLMRELTSNEAYEMVLQFESLAYNEHVIPTETEDHFRRCYQLMAPVLEEAGKRYARNIPARTANTETHPKIGFVLNNSGLLAHSQVLLDYLCAYAALPDRRFTPVVYILFRLRGNSRLVQGLTEAGIAIYWVEDQVPNGNVDTIGRLTALRNHARTMSLHAAVWVSVVPCMAFSFAMRLAPVQVWWSMKYHSLDLQSIDEYLTGWSIGRTKKIGERVWRSGRLGLPNWYDPNLSSEARAIRMQFDPERIIIGSFGREEKLDSGEFLLAICRILRANSRVMFLWTGRSQLPSIDAIFREQNVAGQTRFIGWVNTKLYAQVIDIFADSFPFPCGLTAVQAMAAGKPIVMYESAEAMETGIHGIVSPILAGTDGSIADQSRVQEIFSPPGQESAYYCARNDAQYVAYLQKLIDDVALRSRAGDACKQFVSEFFSDVSGMCRSFTDHLVDALKLGKTLSPGAETDPW